MNTTFKTVDAETLSSSLLRKPVFVLDGLISRGINILCGSAKTVKSWLALWLAVQLSLGLPVWDIKTQKTDVLYLCLEDTYERIQSRLFTLSEVMPDNLYLGNRIRQLGEGFEQDIIYFLKDHPNIKVIIIDTFQKIMNNKGTSGKNGMYGNDYADISVLKDIADKSGISMILIHHLRKMQDTNDPFNQISGSTGILGAVDAALLLKREYPGSDIATLTVRGRDNESSELKLKIRRKKAL